MRQAGQIDACADAKGRVGAYVEPHRADREDETAEEITSECRVRDDGCADGADLPAEQAVSRARRFVWFAERVQRARSGSTHLLPIIRLEVRNVGAVQ